MGWPWWIGPWMLCRSATNKIFFRLPCIAIVDRMYGSDIGWDGDLCSVSTLTGYGVRACLSIHAFMFVVDTEDRCPLFDRGVVSVCLLLAKRINASSACSGLSNRMDSGKKWNRVKGPETAPPPSLGQLIRISVRRCAIDLLIIIANSCLLFPSPSLHRRFRQ